MLYSIHFFPGLVLLALGIALQTWIYRQLPGAYRRSAWPRVAATTSAALLALGYVTEFRAVLLRFPPWWSSWIESAALFEIACLIGVALAVRIWNKAREVQPARRAFLEAAASGLCVAPAAVAVIGLLQHNRFRVSEVRIPVPDLPRDLDGLSIVQVTDIHRVLL